MAEPPTKRKTLSTVGTECDLDEAQSPRCNDITVARLDIEAVRIELVCSICLDLPSQVATVLPCLHSFCWSCIEVWFKSHYKCPRCAQAASSARPNAALNNLVQAVLEADPSLAKPADLVKLEKIRFDDYRLHRSAAAVLFPASAHSADDDDESDVEPEEPLRYWPCPCCSPGNRHGYVCSAPIPVPPGAVRPYLAPARGESWPDLSEAVDYISSDMTDTHKECNFCGSWVPRKGLPASVCGGCQSYTCAPYDSEGVCPLGEKFATLDKHESLFDNLPVIRGESSFNLSEIERVRGYMTDHKISVYDVYTCMVLRAQALIAENVSSHETTENTSGSAHESNDLHGSATNDNHGQPQANTEMPVHQALEGLEGPQAKEIASRCLAQKCNSDWMGVCHEFDLDRAVALLSASFCETCALSVTSRLIVWWWLDIRANQQDTLPSE